jgi:predicted transcriptional regulator
VTERKHEPVFPGFGDMARRRQELVDDLAARRRAIGLSQTEVQSAVARLESGHSDVRFSTLERYAAALDQHLDWRRALGKDKGTK